MSEHWTEDIALEWEILRWAAGTDIALPCQSVPDERRLMARVVTHRLGPRLLQRLKRENARPLWLSEWVLTHLRGQNAKTLAQIEMRFRALREICAAVPDAPPLLLKGFAPYAATGDARFMRPSGDLDLLASDPEPFCQVLRSLGYGIVAASANAHEFATAGRGSIGIEVHRFVPIYSFPPGVENAELELGQFSSAHFQTFAAPPRHEIRYDDIWPHAVAAQAVEVLGLRVPDVTTTAFILCAHEFRELIQSPFELLVPVRLALLADIYELALHPDFDSRRFLALAHSWGDSSIRVMGHFLRTVFGSNPLPCDAFPNSSLPLPRQIGVRGIWTALGTARECLMGLERSDILERLQSSSPRFFQDDHSCQLASSSNGEVRAMRSFVHHLSGEPLLLRLRTERTRDQFYLQLNMVPLAERGLEYKIRLDSASGLINTVSLYSTGRWEQKGLKCASCQREKDASVRWTLTPSDGPLFISVSRRDSNMHDFYNAQCVIALIVPQGSSTISSGASVVAELRSFPVACNPTCII